MFKSLLLSTVVAFTLAACAHTAAQTCACGKDKQACADNKECPMHKKEAGCSHCKESEEGKGK